MRSVFVFAGFRILQRLKTHETVSESIFGKCHKNIKPDGKTVMFALSLLQDIYYFSSHSPQFYYKHTHIQTLSHFFLSGSI